MQVSGIGVSTVNKNSKSNKPYTSFNNSKIQNISNKLTKPIFFPRLTIVDFADAAILSAAFGLVYALIKNVAPK